MANYYLIITTKEDYMLDIKNQFKCAGFPDRNKASVKKMEPGDKIIYYVMKQSKFCAAVEVTGTYFYSKTQIWSDFLDLWTNRVPTIPIVFRKSYYDGVYIKDIWDNLEMITNKGKWGSQVMGSFRKLSEHDYNVILTALKEGAK